jgi:hypothetical protein
VPQRGISYVQICLSIVLYSKSLFSSDSSEFLPMIQYVCLSERSNEQGNNKLFEDNLTIDRHMSECFKCLNCF